MTDVKSLLEKMELFERLAVYGGTRAFIKSLAQTSEFERNFGEARRSVQNAKDAVRGKLLRQLGPRWVQIFYSIMDAPNDVNSLQKQVSYLDAIRDALYKQGEGDTSNSSTIVALNISNNLKKAKELISSLQESSDFEGSLLRTTVEDTSSDEVKSEKWQGPMSDYVDPNTQLALNELFNLKLKPDGVLGPLTVNALKLFKNQFNNIKNERDPHLHQDVINAAKDKRSGLIRKAPF